MEVNGWQLFEHALFKAEYDKLLAEVEKIALTQPDTYQNHITTKKLKRITELISEEIPADPGHERFRQGKTLGAGYQRWRRAKFGKDHRYRLFFRYEERRKDDKAVKVIIYVWMNNDKTLRKEGDKNDPYFLFAKGLKEGAAPRLHRGIAQRIGRTRCYREGRKARRDRTRLIEPINDEHGGRNRRKFVC